ncbi:hypothetical protein Kpol_499p19 [Vanderwaltozyma polyspora DSM 70294]|uniref:Biogenesis of lysosome-related organelles complex 1 subunit VAB2 n=1 Tax=Vanderwaltozyma polyspora (strain ATCC 22028 / DSM 70294 / BCRC 21397 / CBS 2163 / NBRC 10782 / NRRL Y-8283 / UCD 57-17) TaxID=436907 RepID=VAB2_VANPO|nr:uncharacterized protein Kpol_499p19 [Vanderwaltozyma polyspora DSM 70294]A7TP22.1 RecName: Full=Biogenesis of lysosome-related organelles complex 1 subunit VAB2; Short=BLOC-1 subunit VAB2 [Vanderwaltozyma polyspora DSM 70294]EDO15991.1 hypothetical protein Kpol_499p19 [Vanderwaltozyma polyspora DSM 70294]
MRNKLNFQNIEHSYAFKELSKLPSIVSSKQLRTNSIFEAVKPELKNVQNDIQMFYSVIEREINSEISQIDLVETELKKSLKNVNKSYAKIMKRRTILSSNGKNKNLAIVDDFNKEVDGLESLITGLKETVHDMIDDLVTADSQLKSNNKSVTKEEINSQHYPLLFEILQKDYNHIFKESNNLSVQDADRKSIELDIEDRTEVKSSDDKDSMNKNINIMPIEDNSITHLSFEGEPIYTKVSHENSNQVTDKGINQLDENTLNQEIKNDNLICQRSLPPKNLSNENVVNDNYADSNCLKEEKKNEVDTSKSKMGTINSTPSSTTMGNGFILPNLTKVVKPTISTTFETVVNREF